MYDHQVGRKAWMGRMASAGHFAMIPPFAYISIPAGPVRFLSWLLLGFGLHWVQCFPWDSFPSTCFSASLRMSTRHLRSTTGAWRALSYEPVHS